MYLKVLALDTHASVLPFTKLRKPREETVSGDEETVSGDEETVSGDKWALGYIRLGQCGHFRAQQGA